MFSKEKLGIYKVPTTPTDAMSSSLLSLFQKKNIISFYNFLDKFNKDDPSTFGKLDPKVNTMQDYYKKFGLDDNSADFLGHAVGMYKDDAYLQQPAIETFEKLQLFVDSMGKYGDSPFLYPIYGLGGLPESFSRLCAIHGGTYMLNTKVDEILVENGKCVGIRSGEETAKAPMIICDPSYVAGMNKTKVVGKVIRAICLLDKPIPNTKDVPSI
jgi:Rab GDP dissociation inhibitor